MRGNTKKEAPDVGFVARWIVAGVKKLSWRIERVRAVLFRIGDLRHLFFYITVQLAPSWSGRRFFLMTRGVCQKAGH